MHKLIAAAVIALAGCSPFVVEIDEPSFCSAGSGARFKPTATGVVALVPLDMDLGQTLSQPGVQAQVELGAVTLTARDGRSLGFASAARIHVLPAAATDLSGVASMAASSAPVAQGDTLTIEGSGADILPALTQGPVQLAIELDGANAPADLIADVGACVSVHASGQYLK